MAYRITYRADCEGDWTDDPSDGQGLRFASREEAEEWWAAHYRGPDDYGNQAYPSVVVADDSDDWCPLCGTCHEEGRGPAGYSCEAGR